MLIQVTQEDIDCGVKKSAANCPWARAFRRVMKPEFVVMAGMEHLWIMKKAGDDPIHKIELPGASWRKDFDQGRPVTPIEFDYPLPEEVCKSQ